MSMRESTRADTILELPQARPALPPYLSWKGMSQRDLDYNGRRFSLSRSTPRLVASSYADMFMALGGLYNDQTVSCLPKQMSLSISIPQQSRRDNILSLKCIHSKGFRRSLIQLEATIGVVTALLRGSLSHSGYSCKLKDLDSKRQINLISFLSYHFCNRRSLLPRAISGASCLASQRLLQVGNF